MKKSLLVLLACLLLAPSAASAKVLTNVDWLLMSPAERLPVVDGMLKDFRAKGLPFGGEVPDYVARIDAVVADPRLPNRTPLDKILLTIGYADEPAVRQVVDAAEARRQGKKGTAS